MVLVSEYSGAVMQREFFVALLVCAAMVRAPAQTPDGVGIVGDLELFSTEFLAAFVDMNETFGDFGFEVETLEAERVGFDDITAKYGEPEESENIEVVLGFGNTETRATLRFFYYGDIGFGVKSDDPQKLVIRVKRREG